MLDLHFRNDMHRFHEIELGRRLRTGRELEEARRGARPLGRPRTRVRLVCALRVLYSSPGLAKR